MANMRVTMEVGPDRVAVIRISNPPVNALAPPIIAGLKAKYEEAMRRDDVKAIVLTGEGGRFSGGFDINVFQKVHKNGDLSVLPDVSVDLVVNTMEDGKKPSVAAIEGLALGGGLELAMGCHARIATPKTQLGLPELTLGVIPGFGGTQRLPRLVGLSKAIEMMLLSKPILSEQGMKLGLIDEVVSSKDLLRVARAWASDIADRRKPWISSLQRTDKLGSLAEAREILKVAKQQAKKTAPNMPQHHACLDVIEEGVVFGGYAGVLKEAKIFNELVLSSTSKGLVHVFFAQRLTSKVSQFCQYLTKSGHSAWDLRHTINRIRRMLGALEEYTIRHVYRPADRLASLNPGSVYVEVMPSSFAQDLKDIVHDEGKPIYECNFQLFFQIPNVTDIGLKPRKIKKVAVIGGGLMGSGIATALILSGASVLLKEINKDYLQKGIRTIEGNLRGLVTKGKLTQDKAEKAFSLIKGVLDYTDFKHVDMVIEAVIENISLKQSIFSELEKVCPPHCILATNTSTIDLNLVGEKTSSHDRIVGAHFFSPAHVMPLLEIVRTDKTSAQVILDLMTVGKAIKKVPVVVGNCTGFAVNRTFFPYTQGAHILAHLGVDVFRIDRVISNFGMPMGPFQLQDLAGYGVFMAVGKEFATSFPDRTFRSPLVELLIKSGRNGKNNGKGYYTYERGSRPKPDPSVLPIIQESIRLTNIMPGGKPISVSDQEILEMVLFPVVNEACRVLDEGVVVRASDLDIASVLGMSFPSYRGGIVFWGDLVGSSYIYSRLKKWAETYGSFFKPSRFLEERGTKGILLSEPASASQLTRSRM